jgi:GTPase
MDAGAAEGAGLDLRGFDQLAHDIATGTRTLVIGPYLTARAQPAGPIRNVAARLDEARGLALAIDLTVIAAHHVPLAALRPATYLGKGKVEEIAAEVENEEIGLVVIDAALSPVQQRNLEKAFKTKVIDRTGLILEIFGRRAQTREGSLQVELAHLGYQKSRLVRSWTHLERQRGGFGFLGGPGETQIEADRRLIQERMNRLEKDLDQVRRTRGLHRAGRRRVPYPIVALVGYTNAGKSSLFNRLTHAEVMAKDMLFATLDPTARAIKLPHGGQIVLSDTVGFISDLPTTLIAAFRATLEDAIEADLLLHIRDVSHEDTQAQAEDVTAILKDLGIGAGQGPRVIEVWNKADLLAPGEHQRQLGLASSRTGPERPMLVSALTGEGIDALVKRIEDELAANRQRFSLTLPATDGHAHAWLHDNVEVMARKTTTSGDQSFVLRVAPEREGQFLARFPSAKRIARR